MNFLDQLGLEANSLYQSFITLGDSEEEILSCASKNWHIDETNRKVETLSNNSEIFFNLIVNKKISDKKLYDFMLNKNIKPLGEMISFVTKKVGIVTFRDHFFKTYEAKLCPRLLPELLCLIFSKCSLSTLKNIAASNKEFCQLSSSNLTWGPIASRLYPEKFQAIASEQNCKYKKFVELSTWCPTKEEKICLSLLEKHPKHGHCAPSLNLELENAFEAMRKNDPKSFKYVDRVGGHMKEMDATDFFDRALGFHHTWKRIIESFQKNPEWILKADDQNLSMTGKQMAETLIQLFTKTSARISEAKCYPTLPPKLLCQIFSKCSLSTLYAIAISNKQFNRLSSSPLTWVPIALRLHPEKFRTITSEQSYEYKKFVELNTWSLTQEEKTCLSLLEKHPEHKEDAILLRIKMEQAFRTMRNSNPRLYPIQLIDNAISFFKHHRESPHWKMVIRRLNSDVVFLAEDKSVSMTGKEMADTLTHLFTKAIARLPADPKDEAKA